MLQERESLVAHIKLLQTQLNGGLASSQSKSMRAITEDSEEENGPSPCQFKPLDFKSPGSTLSMTHVQRPL